MTQVTSAIKVNEWENDISWRKKKKDHEKNALLKNVKMAANNEEHYSLPGINK